MRTEGVSRASIPLQLAASTLGVGYIGMKVGEYMGGSLGGVLGLTAGLVIGFFGYIAVIIRREQ